MLTSFNFPSKSPLRTWFYFCLRFWTFERSNWFPSENITCFTQLNLWTRSSFLWRKQSVIESNYQSSLKHSLKFKFETRDGIDFYVINIQIYSWEMLNDFLLLPSWENHWKWHSFSFISFRKNKKNLFPRWLLITFLSSPRTLIFLESKLQRLPSVATCAKNDDWFQKFFRITLTLIYDMRLCGTRIVTHFLKFLMRKNGKFTNFTRGEKLEKIENL